MSEGGSGASARILKEQGEGGQGRGAAALAPGRCLVAQDCSEVAGLTDVQQAVRICVLVPDESKFGAYYV